MRGKGAARPLGAAARLLLTAAGLLLAGPGGARADQQDPLYLTVGGAISYDDNLFRLSGAANPAALGIPSGESDVIKTLQVSLVGQQAWSLQQVKLSVSEAINRFAQHSYLDNSDLSYSAAWDWQFTPHLTGTLSASQSQTLAGFGDFRNYAAANLVTADNRQLGADWWLAGPWHVESHLSEAVVTNSTNFVQQASYRQYGGDIGVRLVSAADNWVRVLARQWRGSYPGREVDPVLLFDTSFEQTELECGGHWAVSGRTNLDATVTVLDRRYAHFAQRDFHGSSGTLELDWNATGRLLVKALASRDTHDYEDRVLPFYTSSYLIETDLSAWAILTLSERETLTLRYLRGDRAFEGPLFTPLEARHDTPTSLLVQLDWTPWRTAQLSLALHRDARGSNIPGFNFIDNSFSLNGQWSF